MPTCPRSLYFAFALMLAVLLGACDTDNPSSPLEELEGVYAFTEFRFDPSASAIADADVLARLVAANTNVELFGSGRALVRYKLVDRPSNLVDATFTATRSSARLTATTETDETLMARILLPASVSFARTESSNRLTAQILTTADLASFDPQAYAGVPPVPGTLYVTLERNEN